jgi:hypothetical protein
VADSRPTVFIALFATMQKRTCVEEEEVHAAVGVRVWDAGFLQKRNT